MGERGGEGSERDTWKLGGKGGGRGERSPPPSFAGDDQWMVQRPFFFIRASSHPNLNESRAYDCALFACTTATQYHSTTHQQYMRPPPPPLSRRPRKVEEEEEEKAERKTFSFHLMVATAEGGRTQKHFPTRRGGGGHNPPLSSPTGLGGGLHRGGRGTSP